jgi:hypothetical protein
MARSCVGPAGSAGSCIVADVSDSMVTLVGCTSPTRKLLAPESCDSPRPLTRTVTGWPENTPLGLTMATSGRLLFSVTGNEMLLSPVALRVTRAVLTLQFGNAPSSAASTW